MGHGDIEGRCRYFNFFLNDIARSVVGFHGLGDSGGFRTVADLIHSPKYLFQQFLFAVIHRGNFLGVVRVGGGLDGVYRQHLRPDGAGAGHFKRVMGGAVLDLVQLALVFLVDLPDNCGHGLACTAVLPGKKDAKTGADDQANQADNHNGKDSNPAPSGNSGHKRLNGRNHGLYRGGNALCGGFRGGGGGLGRGTGGMGGHFCRLCGGLGRFLCRLCRMVCGLDGGFRRMLGGFHGALCGTLCRLDRPLCALDGALCAPAGGLCGLPHSLGGPFRRFYGRFHGIDRRFHLPGRFGGVLGLYLRWPVRLDSPVFHLPFPFSPLM